MSVVFGCIVPHPPVLLPEVGRRDADVVKQTATGLRQLAREMAAAHPDVGLLVSPHGDSYADAMAVAGGTRSAGDFLSWGASGLPFQYDNDLDLSSAVREEAA